MDTNDDITPNTSETPEADAAPAFEALGLSAPLLRAIKELGYESPTPIQERTIPPLLEGRDLIGQAHTGTGKTAAFALPVLQRLDLRNPAIQALVLTPTRELALQVAEAFHSYARYLGHVHVLPIYGGQAIDKQMRRLQQRPQVIVGTPGRIMDHMRRGTLALDALEVVVLDEADEMLRMGFAEDVEWILGHSPERRQVALFSATMPVEIRRIATQYLKDALEIRIAQRTLTVPSIQQRYLQVSEQGKLDALTRILEIEQPEAVLIFARTKVSAQELAEKLQARGFAAEPMHGDMNQSQRESAVNRLRRGQSEIIVATDVAARGWDVERITHVINYDVPHDAEAYTHRIGRTGRAGRSGMAILFITPRQQRALRDIERQTRHKIEPMRLPTQADVAARRLVLFKEQIIRVMDDEQLDGYLMMVEEIAEESGRDMTEIAAALARLARGDRPLVVPLEPEPESLPQSDSGMVRLFVDLGRRAGMRPNDIVGAIANEAGIAGKQIGAIDIYDFFTLVDVPAELADQVIDRMRNSMIRHKEATIRRATPRDEVPADEKQGRGDRRDGPRRERRPYTPRRR